jgi:hypothetical protein
MRTTDEMIEIDGMELLRRLAEFRLKDEVVTCQYCKHRYFEGPTEHFKAEYRCELDAIVGHSRRADDPEWFCADGERREE